MSLSDAAKNTVVVILGVGLLLGIEGVLALIGVTPLSREDRFAGFTGASPVFLSHREGGETVFTLNPAKERYFNRQSFRMPKPAGTFRIISFGGSTTYGRPYINDTSFPTWLAKLLGRLDPTHRYESINLGGISYASYRVRRLMDEAAAYDPDLFVVYSGHNEFLEARTFAEVKAEPPMLRAARKVLHHSRIYSTLYRTIQGVRRSTATSNPGRLGEEVTATLEEIGGPELYHRDPVFRDNVTREYRESIDRIAAFARQHGIPLILCTVPSNLSGVSPFKSEHRSDLSQADRETVDHLLAEAGHAMNASDLQGALGALDRAVEIDDAYAIAHFARGEVLRRLGHHAEALAAYNRAKEEDIIPLRALDVFNASVRGIAATREVPLADVEARFRAEAPHGIPGPELFVDHVHPTIKGQQLIAWMVAETAARAGVAPVSAQVWEQRQGEGMAALAEGYAQVSPRYRAMGLWGVGRLFHWAGKYREAYPPLRQAWETVKDVPEIPYLLGDLELVRHNPRAALGYFQEVLKLAPGDHPTHFGMAKAYLALGDGDAALDALASFDAGSEPPPVALLLRGEAELLLGRLGQAKKDIERAAEQNPGVQRFAHSLARIRLATGDEQGAREAFAGYLELLGQPWSETTYQQFREGAALPAPPPTTE